jgi:hypothetical protein
MFGLVFVSTHSFKGLIIVFLFCTHKWISLNVLKALCLVVEVCNATKQMKGLSFETLKIWTFQHSIET